MDGKKIIMVNNLFMLFLLFFTISCSQHTLFKNYCYVDSDTYYEVTFNSNQTFQYYWEEGLSNELNDGIWKREKNKIYLHPNIYNSTYDYTISISDTCKINVLSKKDSIDFGFLPILLKKNNGEVDTFITDYFGEISLPKKVLNNYSKIIIDDFFTTTINYGISIDLTENNNHNYLIYLGTSNNPPTKEFKLREKTIKSSKDIHLQQECNN
jgi:hypothetical protein